MYVGSAALNRMYSRFRAHLYLNTGSKIVNKAVLKYGLINFSFIVIKTVLDPQDKKKTILKLEEIHLDYLKPSYSIVKIAGSVLNLKWTLEAEEYLVSLFLAIKNIYRESEKFI